MAKDETQSKKVESAPTNDKFMSIKARNHWLYALVGVVVLVFVFTAGFAAANAHRDMYRTGGFLGDGYSAKRFVGGPNGPMGGRRVMLEGNNLPDAQDHVRGVVIKVDGSNFTVAGSGSTTNVTTDTSTQYHGGNTVKLNDTIITVGTTSNGTLKASELVINP